MNQGRSRKGPPFFMRKSFEPSNRFSTAAALARLMDIIAAHRQGLIEKLEEEAAALAGRPRTSDSARSCFTIFTIIRAGHHHWALAEARRELRIAEALPRFGAGLHAGDGWPPGASGRGVALEALADALGERSRARCVAAYTAYRSDGTPVLA